MPLLTDDVSFRGVFLRTDSPPPLMQLIRIKFTLPPDNVPLLVHGMGVKIVTAQEARGRSPGVGIEFYGFDGEPRQRWEQFVRWIAQHHPESEDRPVAPGQPVDPVQRRFVRQRAELRVQLEALDSVVELITGDISQGGMFIRTDLPLNVGTEVSVQLVYGSASFPVDCVVRRRVFGTEAGVGVEFLNMNESMRRKLADFVRPVTRIDTTTLDDSELEVTFESEPSVPVRPMPRTGSGAR